MSLTLTTTTRSASPSDPVPHRLLVSLQGQSQHPAIQIAHNLEASHLFSAEGVQKITQFRERFALLDPEINREDASLLICFLLCDVVREALEDDALPLEQVKALLGFDKALVECLRGTLPPGEECTLFIEQFEDYSNEQEKFIDRIGQIDRLFRSIVAKLYETANERNREIREEFEEFKARLLEINNDRREGTEGLLMQIDGLIPQLEQISGVLEAIPRAQDEISRRMLREEQGFEILMDDLKTLLKKV